MSKEEFLAAIRQRIAGLPQSDIDKSLDRRLSGGRTYDGTGDKGHGNGGRDRLANIDGDTAAKAYEGKGTSIARVKSMGNCPLGAGFADMGFVGVNSCLCDFVCLYCNMVRCSGLVLCRFKLCNQRISWNNRRRRVDVHRQSLPGCVFARNSAHLHRSIHPLVFCL